MEMGMIAKEHGYCKTPPADCSNKNKKFWVNERTHRFKKTSLVGLAYTIFLRNPVALSWWLLLIVEAWVLLWVLLSEFGVLTLPTIDPTVPAIIFAAVTFLAAFILNGGLTRRGNNIRNFKSFLSASVNTMSGIESNIMLSKFKQNPMVELQYHDNSRYVTRSVSAIKCTEEVSELLSALIAAQRNVQRGGFDPKLLPLDPWLISEIYSRQRNYPRSDPLVTMQTMIWYRIGQLELAGVLTEGGDKLLEKFNGDLVDSLGNIAIDASAAVPQVFQVFYYFFLILWIIYIPFWLIPLYPSYWVLLAAPLSIVFFTATVVLGNRMPDIYVTSSDNTYSGYNLVQELRVGAANVDQIYMSIFDKVTDTSSGMPEMPPTGPQGRSTSSGPKSTAPPGSVGPKSTAPPGSVGPEATAPPGSAGETGTNETTTDGADGAQAAGSAYPWTGSSLFRQ